MDKERWISSFSDLDFVVTDEEYAQGWHFCDIWDDMLIGPEMPEWDCCICEIKWALQREEKRKVNGMD